jgi:hypothetical protein
MAKTMGIQGLHRMRQPLDYAEDAKNLPEAPIWQKRPRVLIGAAGLAAIAVGAFFITRAVLERDSRTRRNVRSRDHKPGSHLNGAAPKARRASPPRDWMLW